MKISRKLLLAVGLPILAQVCFLTTLLYLLEQSERLSVHEAHSKEVTGRLNWLNYLLSTASLARFGQIETGKEEYDAAYQFCTTSIPSELSALSSLLSDNEKTIKMQHALEESCESVLRYLRAIESNPTPEAALKQAFESEVVLKGLDAVAAQRAAILERERFAFRIGPEAVGSARFAVKLMIAAGAAASVITGFALAIYMGSTIAARLERLTENANRLSSDSPLLPLAEEKFDEIGVLDRTFHNMAIALREAAHRERSIIKEAVDVIFSLDQSSKIANINPACLRQFGYEQQELVGTSIAKLIFPEDLAGAMNRIDAAKSSSEPIFFETRMSKKNGEMLHCLWSSRWSPDLNSLFCVIHDVTERKLAEQMRQDVVAMVTHDIRSPLTNIIAALETLAGGFYGELDERGARLVKRAEASCQQILELAEDLLELEKIESGTLRLQPESIELSDLLERAVEGASGIAQQYGVTLNWSGCQTELHVDVTRMLQVLQNLLTNAAKFSRQGDAVKLTGEVSNGMVQIEVADQGKGIAADNLAFIFDKFHQIQSPEARRDGVGLGLPICKALVELHQGTISCKSNIGEGTTFTITLPLTLNLLKTESLPQL